MHYENLQAFPDDNLRREILGGELYVTPSLVPRHQSVVGAITEALRGYARRTGGKTYDAPFDVVYIGPDRLDIIGAKAILGVPSLFVEVLSDSTHVVDCDRKRDLYARFGVAEYWIVDSDARTIERCSDPAGGRCRTIVTFDRDMHAATLADFALSLEFRRIALHPPQDGLGAMATPPA